MNQIKTIADFKRAMRIGTHWDCIHKYSFVRLPLIPRIPQAGSALTSRPYDPPRITKLNTRNQTNGHRHLHALG